MLIQKAIKYLFPYGLVRLIQKYKKKQQSNKRTHKSIYPYEKQILKKSKPSSPELENQYEILHRISSCSVANRKIPHQLIVNLTTIPSRINKLYLCLESIFHQSYPADKIVLWVDEQRFSADTLPDSIKQLEKRGLEIYYVEDIGPFTSHINAFKKFPNDVILTADDDIMYANYWIESIYREYLKDPHSIFAHNWALIEMSGPKKIVPYFDWIDYDNVPYSKKTSNASHLFLFKTVGGVLFPPNSLDDRVFQRDLWQKLTPKNDEFWYWAMAVLKGTSIKGMRMCLHQEARVLLGSQYESLWEDHNWITVDNKKLEVVATKNDIHFRNLVEYFDLYDTLWKEQNKQQELFSK